MKIDPIIMSLMNLEASKVQNLDLLNGKKHEKFGNLYRYAFIVSKYVTSLKPVNECTANDIADMIEDTMIDKDYDVFLVAMESPVDELKDEYVTETFRAVIPRLQPSLRNFYKKLGAPI